MTKTSEIRQAPAQRRVGTLTLGATLIVAGGVMMVSLFWPEADLRWAVKASPLILISLGVETLLAARSGSSIKYDWLRPCACMLPRGGWLGFRNMVPTLTVAALEMRAV